MTTTATTVVTAESFALRRPLEVGTDGPKWLVERRISASQQLARLELPTEAAEEWRYSRVADLDLESFHPSAPAPTHLADADADAGAGITPGARERETSREVLDLLSSIGDRAGLVRTLDGIVTSIELDDRLATGVEIHAARMLDEQPSGLGELLGPRADAFTALADTCGADAVICTIAAGVHSELPIVVVHEVSGGVTADGLTVFPRAVVAVGRAAQASVIEVFVSGPERVLVIPIAEIDLADGAQLNYTTLQQLGRGAWSIAYQASRIGRDATLRSFVAAFGGDYARHLTQSSLDGENGRSELLAVYLGDGRQVQDLRTFQEHVAARTQSELVFKGAVADESRSVYTGLIHMHRGAKRADASQTNRNLVLSEKAHADSVPNLDIEENDVRCSHASAVGPIDADQLFYLETRGVPPEIAERLVLLGFFDDLLARSPHPGVATHLRRVVAERLAASVLAPVGITEDAGQ